MQKALGETQLLFDRKIFWIVLRGKEEMTLFHGSNVVVQKPKVLTNGYYKDFGYGFYCTNLEKQAVRWALVKFKYPTHQMVFCTEKALSSLKYERSYRL